MSKGEPLSMKNEKSQQYLFDWAAVRHSRRKPNLQPHGVIPNRRKQSRKVEKISKWVITKCRNAEHVGLQTSTLCCMHRRFYPSTSVVFSSTYFTLTLTRHSEIHAFLPVSRMTVTIIGVVLWDLILSASLVSANGELQVATQFFSP
jgi:hypothetical protein